MPYLKQITVMAFLLAGCTDPVRIQNAEGSTAIAGSTVTVIDYPMSALPMTGRARTGTVMGLWRMASPEARQACTAQELELAELSLILDTVRYEEWRTSPWSAAQSKEVAALERRWKALGGDVGTLSNKCRAFVAR